MLWRLIIVSGGNFLFGISKQVVTGHVKSVRSLPDGTVMRAEDTRLQRDELRPFALPYQEQPQTRIGWHLNLCAETSPSLFTGLQCYEINN